MRKMTYTEQLQHPKWQERRLRRLEVAAFECENCGDKEKMLHVHHKHYVKGRMAWDYADGELEVLCKDCHSTVTEAQALLGRVVAAMPSACVVEVAALAVAYFYAGGYNVIDEALLAECEQEAMGVYQVGLMAGALMSLMTRGPQQARRFLELHEELTGEDVLDPGFAEDGKRFREAFGGVLVGAHGRES